MIFLINRQHAVYILNGELMFSSPFSLVSHCSTGGVTVWLVQTWVRVSQSSSRGQQCVFRRPGEATERDVSTCSRRERCCSSRHAGGDSSRGARERQASYRPSGGRTDRDTDSCSSAGPPSRYRLPAGGARLVSGNYIYIQMFLSKAACVAFKGMICIHDFPRDWTHDLGHELNQNDALMIHL